MYPIIGRAEFIDRFFSVATNSAWLKPRVLTADDRYNYFCVGRKPQEGSGLTGENAWHKRILLLR
jgi:hypothetical protein